MKCPPSLQKVSAGMVVLLLAGSVAAGVEPVKAPTIRRVWIGPHPSDIDDDWAVSSDGRFLVYRDAAFKLALHDLHTGKTRQLPIEVSQQQGRVGFAWSRTGSYLAFNRQTRGGEQLQVIVLKTLREHTVARLDGAIAPIGWSADSNKIAVTIQRGTNVDIGWVSLETGSVRVLTSIFDAAENGRPFSAVISPDSQQIAFTRPVNGRGRDIFTIREDGTGEKPAVEHAADDYPVGYTSDSKRLLFASDRSGSVDLWSTRVAGNDNGPSIPIRIRRDLGVINPIGIASNQSLYYVLSQCSADVFTSSLSPTYDAILPSKVIATRFAGYNSGPDWSPSGEEIVYQVGQAGSPDGISLVFLNLQTGEERLVFPLLLQFSRPRYTAGGKFVVVHGVGRDGVQGLYQVDSRSGAQVLLARGEGDELANPIWAAGGKILFFERGGNSV